MLPPAPFADGPAGRACILPATARGDVPTLSPSWWLRTAPLAAVELANKAETFGLFQSAAGSAANGPLAEGIRQAWNSGAFSALWTAEGLGHGFAASACHARWPRGGLLARLDARALPAGAWLPLHTGMGLALAERTLDGGGNLDVRLHRFEELCRTGSQPGYAMAAFEGLGFVARTLHSGRVSAIERILRARSAELSAYFWHGVGRGLYFSPLHAFPGGTLAALVRAGAEPPAAAARANAVAGVAWALSLVNLRHGEVLERIVELAAAGLGRPAREALAQGMGAALAAWAGWVHAGPAARGPGLPRVLGNPRIRRAFEEASANCRAGRVEEIFRYR